MPEQLRVARLRELMSDRGYDAVLVTNNADIRWLTNTGLVLDDERAHAAFITQDDLFLHTDSRYFGAFQERLSAAGVWKVDERPVTAQQWCAEHIAASRTRALALEDSLSVAFHTKLVRQIEDRSICCTTAFLHDDIAELRAVKDEDEIAVMRRAQNVTDEAFEHMCSFIRPGLSEKDVRAELDSFMLAHGADGLSFETIVASGPNTANPHAKPSQRIIQPGDFVLMDYGASVEDYCSDMTRTVVVGTPSDQQRIIYDTVRTAHETAAKAICPGKTGVEIHQIAVDVIDVAGYGQYFTHSLGHGVGIDIHEQPCLNKRDKHTLAPGHVVTVEPGIYLPGVGGVRLEDYGVVTSDGFDVFTSSTHELVVIE